MYLDFLYERFLENPEKDAVISSSGTITYGELHERCSQATHWLKDHNIESGSIVAVRADFSPLSIAMFLALIEHGCIVVPISYAVKNREEYYRIAQVEAIIETSDEYKLIPTGHDHDHELLRTLTRDRLPGLILFSSGTTGKSKASVHNFIPLLEKFQVTRPIPRTITFMLFDHIGGVNTLLAILSSTGTVITIADRAPETVFEAVQKYGVELLPTTPSFLNLAMISRAWEKFDISSLKTVTYGTEPMPEHTLKSFNRLFPDIRLKQTYGLSEIGIMRSKSKSSDSLWMKIGGEGFALSIRDGILWVKAKSSMLGYLNAPSPFDEEGWFNTGDRVVTNGEWVRILGRDSEIINVGGQKVYPAEVESAIAALDNIRDVTVKGVKNPILGSVVSAELILDQDEPLPALKNRIRRELRDKIESYKIPVHIKVSTDFAISSRYKKVRR